MMAIASYIIFAGIVMGLAAYYRSAFTVVILYMLGMILLPAAPYPIIDPKIIAPYWIIGSGLPSDLLMNKTLIVASTCFVAAILFCRERAEDVRLRWIDAPVFIFCLLPLVTGLSTWRADNPAPLIASAYLFGTWATTWLVGRICLRTEADRLRGLQALSYATLALVPIALVETFTGPIVHNGLLSRHPFTDDGAVRYVGYRPLGLFEHGNQYGLWVACAALAALWVALYQGPGRQQSNPAEQRRDRIIAAILVVMTLASQSAGAILLLALGAIILFIPAIGQFARMAAIPAAFVLAMLGAGYVSNALPIRSMVEQTSLGQKTLGSIRATGRGSFAWRISQDVKTIPLIHSNLIAGHGQWDWFRPAKTRPWGFWILLAGQYGLMALGTVLTLFLWPVLRVARVDTQRGMPEHHAPPLVALVLIAMADMQFNSFLFWPAILFAAALASRTSLPRRRSSRIAI